MSTEFPYKGTELKKHWAKLHAGDCEPYPTVARVSKAAKSSAEVAAVVSGAGGPAKVVAALEDAWRAFHSGDFMRAIEVGHELGAIGASVANKAAGIHTLYVEKNDRKRLDLLRAAIKRGEAAVQQLPGDANVHYTLAMVLGRYSQRISILEAVAAGFAGKIRDRLERTLKIEPKHAEACVALGLYHAELVKTLGSLAARLTYGASQKAAIENFRRAVSLAPRSAIAHVEFAHGLELLDAAAHRDEVEEQYAQAASFEPLDVMEQLDIERARHHHRPGA